MNPVVIKQMLAVAEEGSEIKRTAKVLATAGITERDWLADPLYRQLPSPYALGLANALRGMEMGYYVAGRTAASDAVDCLKRAIRIARVPKPPRE